MFMRWFESGNGKDLIVLIVLSSNKADPGRFLQQSSLSAQIIREGIPLLIYTTHTRCADYEISLEAPEGNEILINA